METKDKKGIIQIDFRSSLSKIIGGIISLGGIALIFWIGCFYKQVQNLDKNFDKMQKDYESLNKLVSDDHTTLLLIQKDNEYIESNIKELLSLEGKSK